MSGTNRPRPPGRVVRAQVRSGEPTKPVSEAAGAAGPPPKSTIFGRFGAVTKVGPYLLLTVQEGRASLPRRTGVERDRWGRLVGRSRPTRVTPPSANSQKGRFSDGGYGVNTNFWGGETTLFSRAQTRTSRPQTLLVPSGSPGEVLPRQSRRKTRKSGKRRFGVEL